MKLIEEMEELLDGSLDKILRKNSDKAELRIVPPDEFMEKFGGEKTDSSSCKGVFADACVIYFDTELSSKPGRYHLINMGGAHSTSAVLEIKHIAGHQYAAFTASGSKYVFYADRLNEELDASTKAYICYMLHYWGWGEHLDVPRL